MEQAPKQYFRRMRKTEMLACRRAIDIVYIRRLDAQNNKETDNGKCPSPRTRSAEILRYYIVWHEISLGPVSTLVGRTVAAVPAPNPILPNTTAMHQSNHFTWSSP